MSLLFKKILSHEARLKVMANGRNGNFQLISQKINQRNLKARLLYHQSLYLPMKKTIISIKKTGRSSR